MPPLPMLAAVLLAAVHLVAGRMRFLHGVPRSRWLSAAGGVSVAYVFLHLLPELSEHQALITDHDVLAALEAHVYVLALVGLVVFYGAERAIRRPARSPAEQAEGLDEGMGLFWLHLAMFALYNLVIGYVLLEREAGTPARLALYTTALALHFVVVDFGLWTDHRDAWARTARWVLAVALLGGAGLGLFVELSPVLPAAATAFLAGGIVLNVLKEELPEERESRLWAFVAGTAGYAALLLAV